MKRIFLIVVVLMFATAGFCEDEKAEQASAGKLLELLKMEETFEKNLEHAMEMSLILIEEQNLSGKKKREARSLIEASMQVTKKKFSWEKMKPFFIEIYTDMLTLEEIDGMIKFCKSPIGEAYIKKQPKLAAAVLKKIQKLTEKHMPEIQKEAAASIKATKEAELFEEEQ